MNKPLAQNRTGMQEPQKVVMEYLDALLSEVEPLADAAPAEAVVAEPAIAEAPVPADVPVGTPVAEQDELPDLANLDVDSLAEAVPGLVDEPTPLAANEFQVLLFEVSGVRFAVSLDKLNGILEWSDEVTPMPNRTEYFLGLLDERGGQIKVIDTALVVVPAKFRAEHGVDKLRKIILIGDSQWGLACDEVSEVVTLRREDVRWRGEGSKRPWLAGTVIEQMCALLDVDEFATLLGSDQLEVVD